MSRNIRNPVDEEGVKPYSSHQTENKSPARRTMGGKVEQG